MNRIMIGLFGISLIVACTPTTLPDLPYGLAQDETTPLAAEIAVKKEDALSSVPAAEAITITATSEPTVAVEETILDGRQAVFPNTILVYQREGRFPGSPQQWTFYATGRIVAGDGAEWQVPKDQVQPMFDFVASPEFPLLKNAYGPAGECLDCLVHTVTIYGPDEPREITFVQDTAGWPTDLDWLLREIDRLVSDLGQ